MSNQSQLEKLNEAMLACSKCALRSGCTQVVPGAGPADAKIMFIGEAPGKKEDETGVPFVGAAGKFLDEMLGIISLKREETCPSPIDLIAINKNIEKENSSKVTNWCGVYIANVCKCRPPENRDPLPEEIAICWPWLLEQIKIIQPKLIVTLGKHSMERFLPGFKISEIHGKAMRREIEGIGKQVFYTLYHPAAALYNGGMRETLIKDFKRIPRIIKKIETEEK